MSTEITLAGVAIDGSPFVKTIEPAAVSVADTTATGNGVNFMIADQEILFDIEARDRFGNIAEGSNLNFHITITRDTTLGDAVTECVPPACTVTDADGTPAAFQSRTDDNCDYVSGQVGNDCIDYEFVGGKFLVKYMGPRTTGEYKIAIAESLSSSPIAGSPFENVICDTTTDGKSLGSWGAKAGSYCFQRSTDDTARVGKRHFDDRWPRETFGWPRETCGRWPRENMWPREVFGA